MCGSCGRGCPSLPRSLPQRWGPNHLIKRLNPLTPRILHLTHLLNPHIPPPTKKWRRKNPAPSSGPYDSRDAVKREENCFARSQKLRAKSEKPYLLSATDGLGPVPKSLRLLTAVFAARTAG